MRRRALLVALLGILSSLAPAFASAAPRTVVFLLLDTTRGDRVPSITPALDRLAASGVGVARPNAH
jgi:hypothetical protein